MPDEQNCPANGGASNLWSGLRSERSIKTLRAIT